jgi:hypothetical protein
LAAIGLPKLDVALSGVSCGTESALLPRRLRLPNRFHDGLEQSMPILNWLTRDQDIGAAKRVPYRLFEEAAELSAGDPSAGNMLIQGDNLEALKALLPFYAGQVKCIYIDPPFNTGQAFDNYDDNLEHTQWLAMMWPRLETAARPAGRGRLDLGFDRRQRGALP